jgi:N-acetylglucosamine-6-phosphate deacetylase
MFNCLSKTTKLEQNPSSTFPLLFSLEKAVAMTSLNAAQYISENNKGKIDEGFCSNLVVLDKQLNIKKVYLHGSLIS